MTPNGWFRRVAFASSWLALTLVVALPACDSSSKDEDTEAADDDDGKKKKKKRKKKKKGKKEKKEKKAEAVEVPSVPGLFVPGGGDHMKKDMGKAKIDAYVYKPLSKFPLDQLKAEFVKHNEEKGWKVDGNGMYTVKKGETKIDVFLVQNTKSDACVLNVMGPPPKP